MTDMKISYGQSIPGPTAALTVSGYRTHAQAVEAAVRAAIAAGWEPPRWWMFWREAWSAETKAVYYRQIWDASND